MSFNTNEGPPLLGVAVAPPLAPPTTLEMNSLLPNGHLMTPHDQRRRAALLADSPELSSRPPLNAGGGSGSVLGVLQEAHTQMSQTGSSSSTTSNQSYGFNAFEDTIEVAVNGGDENSSDFVVVDSSNAQLVEEPNGCCSFCKSNKCTNWKWRFKATFGGLTER